MTGSSRGLICQLGLVVQAADVSGSLRAAKLMGRWVAIISSTTLSGHVGGDEVAVLVGFDVDIRAAGSVGQGVWGQLDGRGEIAAGKTGRDNRLQIPLPRA